MPALLAIDQGTTSTRAILFDERGGHLAVARRELPQHFPQPGWVEHDAARIWDDTVGCVRDVLQQTGLAARDIAGLGITNQRETTVVWDRATGTPIHRAIVWQDRRTSDFCQQHQDRNAWLAERTGLLLDPYFSATKIAWLLDHVDGARRRAERGELACGTIDSWLLWNLTGGRAHADRRHQCLAHGAVQPAYPGLGRRAAGVLRRAARPAAPGTGLRRGFRPHRSGAVRRAHHHRRYGRRSAGRHGRPGLLRAGHGQVHLRHGLLHRAQHGHRAEALAQSAAEHPGLPLRRPDPPMRWRAASSWPARQCSGCAIRCG